MNSKPVIRPYRLADRPAIEEIVKLIWTIGIDYIREKKYGYQIEGKPWHEHKLIAMRSDIQARPDCWFVTELEDRVVGFCSFIVQQAKGIGVVGLNGLHPDMHGKGYGTLQLQFILNELRKHGMKIAEVTTGLNEGHAPARKLYERAGFEPLFDNQLYWMKL
ncbi:MAG: GNAT family N-acetyltransferase [Verrucomicrobia bacterium]|nr:GNAT family N-acetyltransferase [Verrucomicrobiota bacterium]